jgi:hypothetical protein
MFWLVFLTVFNNFLKSRVESKNRQKHLEAMIKKNLNLDVVFMLDCTGSMAPYIETAKSQIKNIITTCIEEHENKVGLGDPSCLGLFSTEN